MRDTDAANNATPTARQDKQRGRQGTVNVAPTRLSFFIRHSIASYLVVAFVWFSSFYPFTPGHVLQHVKEMDCGMILGSAMAPILLPIAFVVLAILAIVSADFRTWRLWVSIAIYFVSVVIQRFVLPSAPDEPAPVAPLSRNKRGEHEVRPDERARHSPPS